MRMITQAVIALSFVGTMAISAPVTTKAQGIYFSGPGVGVEIGNRSDRYRYNRRQYRGYDNTYAYDRRPYYGRYNNNGYGYYDYGGNNSPYDRHAPR